MREYDRRVLCASIASGAMAAMMPAVAFGQQGPGQPVPGQPVAHFGYDDVVKHARDLAGAPFEANPPPLPDVLSRLSFDAWPIDRIDD